MADHELTRSSSTLLASEQMIATVEGGNLWTDDILNVVPLLDAVGADHREQCHGQPVAYAVGIIFGLGTFYIIARMA